MHYSNEVVIQLNQLYLEKYDSAEDSMGIWNLSVECMKKVRINYVLLFICCDF